MYLTVKSLPSLLVRPLRRLALGSTTVDNDTSDGVSHPHSTSCIHYHNDNHGHGIFNHVHGNQDTHMSIVFNLNGRPPTLNDVPSVIEPYQSAIRSLFDILLALRKLHETPSVLALQQQVKSFIPIVACVAKAVETVRRISPRFATHTLFFEIDNQALQYGKSLKQLHLDIREFHLHFSDLMESGVLRGIFLRIFATHRWPSLSRRIQLLIAQNQASLERRLQLLVDPRWCTIVGDAHGELGHLLAHAGIASETRIRHLEVQTIWIQAPTGPAMYAVPLSFCTSWRDITLVVHQYFQAGPESHYICRGDWEMVHVDDNRVLEERSFADALKPEAVFDIGIIVSRCLTQSRYTCPQCSAVNYKNTSRFTNKWIRWCVVRLALI
ncbi:hypothetical protein EYR40_001680 [Pleurotus pulmonarius]|nr:hypothetical protein EYR40_001680 [Pleurotus pulmonarius]